MVLCLIVGCSKRSGRDKDVSFYRVPKIIKNQGLHKEELSRRRRDGFIKAIRREHLTDSILDNDRICSRHFISGAPSALEDIANPDWLPNQHLGHSNQVASAQSRVERYERAIQRGAVLEKRNEVEAAQALLLLSESCQGQTMAVSTGVQTELTRESYLLFEEQISQLQDEIHLLKDELAKIRIINEATLLGADDSCNKLVSFYTGLPNSSVLKLLFKYVTEAANLKVGPNSKLSLFQELMVTLMKLRLNPPMQDLAIRFGVSCTTIQRIFHKWMMILDTQLHPLLTWPDRDDLRRTTPECFKASFSNKVAVIIDCFEVFIERPSSLLARAATWSSYKHHNTAKFLIGITPQGVVSYISKAWGGRVSDKYLTESCGILNNLLPGDVVLADRGFDIADSVGVFQAKLYIPAFTRGKTQLSALEVEETRSIANVRIHVERVIGCVRQKYSILKGTIPLGFLSTSGKEDVPGGTVPLIDRIARVSCALCNLCESVVPFE